MADHVEADATALSLKCPACVSSELAINFVTMTMLVFEAVQAPCATYQAILLLAPERKQPP
jgi:hypothetical protein